MHIICEQYVTVCMKQLDDDFGVPCEYRVPNMLMGSSTRGMISQLQACILYETKTMPMGSSHMKKLEGTEMKMCR